MSWTLRNRLCQIRHRHVFVGGCSVIIWLKLLWKLLKCAIQNSNRIIHHFMCRRLVLMLNANKLPFETIFTGKRQCLNLMNSNSIDLKHLARGLIRCRASSTREECIELWFAFNNMQIEMHSTIYYVTLGNTHTCIRYTRFGSTKHYTIPRGVPGNVLKYLPSAPLLWLLLCLPFVALLLLHVRDQTKMRTWMRMLRRRDLNIGCVILLGTSIPFYDSSGVVRFG